MIKAEGLTMHYGPVVALDNVSFEVGTGEVVALLGPNGAGKSTTMKILTTYLRPTHGTAQVGGINILEDPVHARRKIGYLPEMLPLYMDMEVKAYLKFVGKARGLRGKKLEDRTNVVLDETGLRPMYRKVIRELSKGYKQRTALAQSLIHDPEIVILDEPTSGLDPHQIIEVRSLIKNLAAGKTVLLSTHILQEVEASADRIVIINRGKIVANGTQDELRARATKFDRVRVSVANGNGDVERELRSLNTAQSVKAVDGAYLVEGKAGSELWRSVSGLAKAKNWELKELHNEPLSLEETFLAITERGDA